MILIDTHIWLWWISGQSDLKSRDRDKLDRLAEEASPPCLSAISLWEAQMLFRKQRLQLTLPFENWLRVASDPSVVKILPIDTSVIIALDGLPGDFHGDPADRIIVATAQAYAIPLLTADRAIRRSRIIPLA